MSRRLCDDWEKAYGHPVLLVETFVDATTFQGFIYELTDWTAQGRTTRYTRSNGR